MKKISIRQLSIAAGLAAFSAILQLIHIGYQSPAFGMWIDIVAVTWIVALFLFDLKMSLLVSTVGALIITLFAPDTWLGASMKWVATLPIWFLLGIWLNIFKKDRNFYRQKKNLIIPFLLGLIVRLLIVIPLNYFYAIPIWTGLTPKAAILAIPWYIIALFNFVQAVVDVSLAWILVYKFKLERFAKK
jgi:riboflavin transporter